MCAISSLSIFVCLLCTLHHYRDVVLSLSPVGMHSQRHKCPPSYSNLTLECVTSLDPTHPSLLPCSGCIVQAPPPTPAPALSAYFSVSESCNLQSTQLYPLNRGLCSSNKPAKLLYMCTCIHTFRQFVCTVRTSVASMYSRQVQTNCARTGVQLMCVSSCSHHQ